MLQLRQPAETWPTRALFYVGIAISMYPRRDIDRRCWRSSTRGTTPRPWPRPRAPITLPSERGFIQYSTQSMALTGSASGAAWLRSRKGAHRRGADNRSIRRRVRKNSGASGDLFTVKKETSLQRGKLIVAAIHFTIPHKTHHETPP